MSKTYRATDADAATRKATGRYRTLSRAQKSAAYYAALEFGSANNPALVQGMTDGHYTTAEQRD